MANHLELAVSSYIDLIKLGAAVMPNGVVEHLYIGMSCIEVGATNLLPLAYRLAPADCRAIAEELTRVARKIPPPQEAIRREWETFERRFSPRRTLVVRVQRWFPRSRFNQVDARIRADGEASRQLLEKTIRAFAARADESPEAVKK
ncbi:MAG TPA: hypothetical protein VHH73_07410 [Verrucomicrobiae bacterium]|nr:hypothetical protein [Verrucomicrobiae bacterium]